MRRGRVRQNHIPFGDALPFPIDERLPLPRNDKVQFALATMGVNSNLATRLDLDMMRAELP